MPCWYPTPSYPIHPYGFVISGADIRHVPMGDDENEFFVELEKAIHTSWPRPQDAGTEFSLQPDCSLRGTGILRAGDRHCPRALDLGRQDLAYADLCYDGYVALPFSRSRGQGRRGGILQHVQELQHARLAGGVLLRQQGPLVAALARIKSYLDYGMFTPVQVAAIAALEGDQGCVESIRSMYESRRDVLCNGLQSRRMAGQATQGDHVRMGQNTRVLSRNGLPGIQQKLLTEAKVAVSPGVGFGEFGEGFVRFGLIENEHRTRQALRSIKRMIKNDGFA